MNTLEDLRATLHAHADSLGDEVGPARSASVHERVRVVRRRRRAAVAGAMAAVVAVVGGVAMLPGAKKPGPAANRELAGHLAPATLDSLGYRYAFTTGVEDQGTVTLDLPASDRPRLVTWAASGGSLQLSSRDLDLDGDQVMGGTAPAAAADFSDFLLVHPGERGRLRAGSTGGEVALAVYDLVAPAPGFTKDGLTFRQELPDGRLLGAAIGDRGQSEVSLSFTLPDDVIGLDFFCAGSERPGPDLSPWGVVLVNGETTGDASTCAGPEGAYDIGNGGRYVTQGLKIGDRVYSAGDTVTLSVRLVADERSLEPITDPAARLGVAVYRRSGTGLAETMERDGHTYVRSSSVSGSLVDGRVLAVAPDSPWPVIPYLTVRTSSTTEWSVRNGDDYAERLGLDSGLVGMSLRSMQPWQGRELTVRLVRGEEPSGRIRLSFYERVD